MVGLSLSLMLTSASVALAEGPEVSAAPSPVSVADDDARDGLEAGPAWTPVVHREPGPGTTWIEYALGGVVAVLQPDDGAAEAWRSSDGVDWESVALPGDLGMVSDVLPLGGGLAIISDEVRSNQAWSFDLWTWEDGRDWQLASSPTLEVPPELRDRQRTVIGFRSVEGGVVAFESYAPVEPDAGPLPAPSPGCCESGASTITQELVRAAWVFAWQALTDGATWERHEVAGPAREAIGSGSRTLEGDREQLYVVEPGFPPHLLVSASGRRWEDLGALSHGLDDPQGASAIERVRDGFLVAGRPHESGPAPSPDTVTVFRGVPGGHWVSNLTVPDLEVGDLLVDRNFAILVGTTTGSNGSELVGPRRSFVATSTDRGRTWQEHRDIATQDRCLGPLTSIGDVALLGSGCASSGGMAILAARLGSFDAAPKPPTTTTVPRAPQALECDFKGRGVDSGPGIFGEGERGFPDPGAAMRAFNREAWVIPQSGYRELARDETAVLYGYQHKGKVKVAVRVVAVRGAEDDWVADRLTACRLAEYGRKADMGRGVWLWANRWDRTVQERVGPAHCDWQSVRLLYWAPPGTPDTMRATSLYVRDPKGRFRDQWTMPFLRSTTLPSDARYTGFRRAGKAIWLAADERAMYVKDGDRVERWPRIPSGTGCA